MEIIVSSFFECKKSKFYGYLYKVNSENEVIKILEKVKRENKKAKHIVYSYKIGNIERRYEDKEPSGTSATQLLNIINIKKLDNILIIVVRYFGGVLLGRGPLLRAYKTCASKLFK